VGDESVESVDGRGFEHHYESEGLTADSALRTTRIHPPSDKRLKKEVD
jgi:hypothetical protein